MQSWTKLGEMNEFHLKIYTNTFEWLFQSELKTTNDKMKDEDTFEVTYNSTHFVHAENKGETFEPKVDEIRKLIINVVNIFDKYVESWDVKQ